MVERNAGGAAFYASFGAFIRFLATITSCNSCSFFDKLGFWFGSVWLRFGCGSVQGLCRSVETLEWGWKAGCAVSGLRCKGCECRSSKRISA